MTHWPPPQSQLVERLAFLIPPSVILVIYGLMTETSVGKLFIAGVLPGLVGVLFYLVGQALSLSPATPQQARPASVNWGERLLALRDVWTTLGLFIFVAASMSVPSHRRKQREWALPAMLITWRRGALSVASAMEVLRETAVTSAKLFVLLFGALIFSNFVNRAGLPALIDIVTAFDLSPIGVIFIILLIYVLFGCVFESMSMILLTVPIFAPLVEGLGFDLIWFGILVVVVTEISLITRPSG